MHYSKCAPGRNEVIFLVMKEIVISSILFFVSLTVPARAETSYITPEMDAALLEGIDSIYRMKF